MTLAAGAVLHFRYEVLEVLGEGAMSTVYLVHDNLDTPRRYAIKLLEPRATTAQEAAEASILFEQEIKILGLLEHPCIPRLHEAFDDKGRRGLVMDWVDGRTLESIVDKNGPAPESYVLPLAIQMVKILLWLHTHPAGPIVFRDMKPSNVMVDFDGRVHLIDFGVARFWKPGQVADTFPMGTPGFAAPEQYGGAQSGPGADLYALAATLYRTLTGHDPDPDSPQRAPLLSVVPSCSPELESVITACLAPDPARRPATADVLEALLELQRTRYPDVHVPPLPSPVVMPPSPTPRRGLGPAVLLIGALIVAAYLLLPELYHPHRGGFATACKSNLKNLGTALEMYSVDNGGLFPLSLAGLTPNYLRTIPTCPQRGADTYSDGYRAWNGRTPAYTIVCSGNNHAEVAYRPNYPQYTSTQGLLER